MRRALIVLAMTMGPAMPAAAQVSVGIGVRGSGFDIGIHLSSYPDLVRVPGYPVYYNPRGNLNYFFYDGLYWVFENDNWYASSWYDGPWDLIDSYYVPLYVLRIPVRYYRRPPAYFHGWPADSPPRWDEHWGRDWSSRRLRLLVGSLRAGGATTRPLLRARGRARNREPGKVLATSSPTTSTKAITIKDATRGRVLMVTASEY